MSILKALGITTEEDVPKKGKGGPLKTAYTPGPAVTTPLYTGPTNTSPASPVNSTFTPPSNLPDLSAPMKFEDKIMANTFKPESIFGQFLKAVDSFKNLSMDELGKYNAAMASLLNFKQITKEQIVADLNAHLAEFERDVPTYTAQLENVRALILGEKDRKISTLTSTISLQEAQIKELEEKIRVAKNDRASLEGEVEAGNKNYNLRVVELNDAVNKVRNNINLIKVKLNG